MQFLDRNQSRLERVGFLIFLALALYFFLRNITLAKNFPYALDDIRMYLGTFENRFLDGETFFAKIKYFFSQTNYPHTKLVGRFISAIQYGFTGTVNFKFLIISGMITLIGFILVAKRVFELGFLAIVPLALILFSPGKLLFWIGPITGFPFLLLFVLLSFHFLSKGQIFQAATIAFIASFTHSPGIFVFFAGLPMFLVTPNKSIRNVLIWLLFFAATVFVYWYMVLSVGPAGGVARQERSIRTIAQCLPSMIAYEGQFLSCLLYTSPSPRDRG